MFENPLRKYAAGGVTSAQEQKLVQIFSKAASKLNIKPEVLIQKVQELTGEQQMGFMQAIQDVADNENPKPESIQLIQSVFAQPSQAFREGGKIHDFICKHARGGYLSECGCKQEGGQIESAQEGRTLLGRLYNKYIGRYMPNTPEANNRRVRTWTDENGVQHIVESANVNGNATDTYIDINGADTSARQIVTHGQNRLHPITLQPGTPAWRTIMSRNVPQNKQGGKIEKAQSGKSKLGSEKKEENGKTTKENLEDAKQTRAAIKQANEKYPGDSFWKYNLFRDKWASDWDGASRGKEQELYHTRVPGITAKLYTTDGQTDSTLVGYPVMRTTGKWRVSNGEPGWDLARDKWFEILRSNRTTPYAEFMQDDLDRERINHPKPKKDEQGGQIEKAQNGKKVNSKTRTITEVGSGLSDYDAKEMGIDPNTLADTGSIITVYPNKKPYAVDGQVPFWTRNGLVFGLGGVESDSVEDGVRLGKGVPGRKYKVSSVLDQYGTGRFDYNENAKEFPMISRYASPKDTIYYLGFDDFDKNTLGYEEVRSLYNKAVDQPDTFALDRDAYLELQRQKQERVHKEEQGGKVEKAQFGMSVINPKVVLEGYRKFDDALTPANKWEKEYGTKVVGGLGLPAYVSPVATEIKLGEIIGNRIPSQKAYTKEMETLAKALKEGTTPKYNVTKYSNLDADIDALSSKKIENNFNLSTFKWNDFKRYIKNEVLPHTETDWLKYSLGSIGGATMEAALIKYMENKIKKKNNKQNVPEFKKIDSENK